MAEPLAYFITWTTRGTWLHGDRRGWVKKERSGVQPENPRILAHRKSVMTTRSAELSADLRAVVDQTIRDHCGIRGWRIAALNVRSNHVHLVVTAACTPETVLSQLKAWTTRRLNDKAGVNRKWWTRHGSTRWINDHESFAAAVEYVLHHQ